MKVLETERLILRHLTEDDAGFTVQLMNTPSWLKYIGDRNIKTIDAAAKYLREGSIRSYKERGFGFYMVELKPECTPVGMCGIIKREGLEDIDIGFAFLPQFEARGYGYESASAVMDYAKNHLGLNRLIAITSPLNQRSIALLEKLGLTYDKMVRLTSDGEELRQYKIEL